MHIPDPRDRVIAQRYFKPFVAYLRGCQRVLDVASGQGHLLELLQEAGVNAEGVELDANLCELTRGKGLTVTHDSFFDYLKKTPPGAYDGASASHSVAPLPMEMETGVLSPHTARKTLFLTDALRDNSGDHTT